MDSLTNQTLRNIEVIAINDNSLDNSQRILEEYAAQDNRIRVINNPVNQKTAIVRNTGLRYARGEYVSFIDGDDYLDLDFCEKLFELAKREDADIAKGLTKTFQQDGSIHTASDNNTIKKSKFNFLGHLLSAIYRRSMVEKHQIRFHIDFFCFQIQAAYWANNIACRDDVYYNYIRHEGSCDSDVFTLEKWQRLNLGHANFIFNWVNSHEYAPDIKEKYLAFVRWLYFYGYNKLDTVDILSGAIILANTMRENYDCGYNVQNIVKLRRKLFCKHKKVTLLKYLQHRASEQPLCQWIIKPIKAFASSMK